MSPAPTATGTTIGFATIGESPRDDVVPYLLERLGPSVRALEAGILDPLDAAGRRALATDSGRLHMVTRDRDGTAWRIDYELAVPRMQRVVDGLVERGADLVVVICGADWSRVRADVPVVNLGRVFPAVVQALAQNLRLGVIKPDAGQIPFTERKWRELGIDAVVTAASPYEGDPHERVRDAARTLADAGVDMVWMSCIGMPESMRDAVREVLPVPVVMARSLIARVVAEMVGTPLRPVGPEGAPELEASR